MQRYRRVDAFQNFLHIHVYDKAVNNKSISKTSLLATVSQKLTINYHQYAQHLSTTIIIRDQSDQLYTFLSYYRCP